MDEILFVVSESMKDVALAAGIPTGVDKRPAFPACPFHVGDFISFPAAPSLAFRVAWRLYSDGSASKPERWLVGLEQAAHPLAGQD